MSFWHSKKRHISVIGSSNHALLLIRYCCTVVAADPASTTNNNNNKNNSSFNMDNNNKNENRSSPRSVSNATKKIIANQRSSSEDSMKNVLEVKTYDLDDEYTKIITPRQDVLFKKGYLTRKRIPESQPVEENCSDSVENEEGSYVNSEDGSGYAGPPGPYLDPSGMYFIGGGSYEVYDPYTGNVAVVLGPPPAVVTAVSCKPVPLQPVQWFNPAPTNSAEWCCPYSATSSTANQYSTDSQISSETSSGVCESPQEIPEIEEQQDILLNGQMAPQFANNTILTNANTSQAPIYQHQYVYPGYMFGAPIYNMDGVNVQYCVPPNPPPSTTNNEIINIGKRRKKRKRRKRAGDNEELDSSLEECAQSVSGSDDAAEPKIEDLNTPVYGTRYKGQEFIGSTAILPYPTYTPFITPEVAYFQSSELPLTINNNNNQYEGTIIRGTAEIIVDTEQQPNQCEIEFENGLTNNENHVSNNSYPTKKTGSLNVHCKPFLNKGTSFEQNDDKHELVEVGSSSSNSDSGISSPNSDASHVKELYDESTNDSQFKNNQKIINKPNNNSNLNNKNVTNNSKNKKSHSKKSNKKPDTFEITSIIENYKKPCHDKNSSNFVDKNNSKIKKVQFATNVTTYRDPVDTSSSSSSSSSSSNNKNPNLSTPRRRTRKDSKENRDKENNKKETKITKEKETKEESSSKQKQKNEKNYNEENISKRGENGKIKNMELIKNTSNQNNKNTTISKNKINNNTGGGGDGKLLPDNKSVLPNNKKLKNKSDEKFEQTNNNIMDNKSTKNNSNKIICITKDPVLATLINIDELEQTSSSSLSSEVVVGGENYSKFSSCRENVKPLAPPRRKRSSQKLLIQQVANKIVDDVIYEANKKLELTHPITEAVTKWITEQGGLPVLENINNKNFQETDDDKYIHDDDDDDNDDDNDDIIIDDIELNKINSVDDQSHKCDSMMMNNGINFKSNSKISDKKSPASCVIS